MYHTAAVVLAAGQSRRMGAVNKLLIEINGVPMIRSTVSACAAVCDAPVTVVTGYQAREIESVLDGLDAHFVHNPDFGAGQQGSVAAGLRAVAEAATTLVVLGDQPLLDAAALRTFLDAHRVSSLGRISMPVKGVERGNPLAIPHTLKRALLVDRANPGCRRFTRDNPDKVNPVPSEDPAYFTDLDTVEDLNLFQDEHSRPG